MRRLDSIADSMDMSLSKLRETVKDREDRWAAVYGLQRLRHDLVSIEQNKLGTQQQILGDREGHRHLACRSPWGLKESGTT